MTKTVTVALSDDFLDSFAKIPQSQQSKVNKFIRASIKSHLIYDDDIKFAYDSNGDGNNDSEGPRVQFKEIIAVGFTFDF